MRKISRANRVAVLLVRGAAGRLPQRRPEILVQVPGRPDDDSDLVLRPAASACVTGGERAERLLEAQPYPEPRLHAAWRYSLIGPPPRVFGERIAGRPRPGWAASPSSVSANCPGRPRRVFQSAGSLGGMQPEINKKVSL
jgi:hypothetical protein